MLYEVKIIPIIPAKEIRIGPFQTAAEAWVWVEENNNPLMDYDVVPVEFEETDDVHPPWD